MGAWGASAAIEEGVYGLSCPAALGLDNKTVRNVIFLSAGGDQVRVRLSNAFGTRAIEISHATVSRAKSRSSAGAVAGSLRDLTFGGRGQVTLPAGHDVLSDPVPIRVAPLSDLLVSVYVAGKSGPVTGHEFASQESFVASGDHAAAPSGAGYTGIQCWMWVSGVEVPAASRYAGTVVTLGDSITDGFNSTASANLRWPDDLARRLNARPGRTLAVVNAGLVGNLLRKPVPADPQYGIPALDRLDRDVFSQPGVRDIILLEGVNDLAYGATASEIIAADKQIIAKAHARGLRIFGATLTPFKGSIFDSAPVYEATRDAVNKWIMTSRAFDGVIDFASAVASPASPQALKPAFDSGDHSHPSDAGYQAMANAINLSMLLAGART